MKSIDWWIFRIGGVLLGLSIALSPLLVMAHESWINRQNLTDPLSKQTCCNKNDCVEEQVREVIGGYLVMSGEVIPYSRVIWASPEGTWVRCRNTPTDPKSSTRCLIGPPPAL